MDNTNKTTQKGSRSKSNAAKKQSLASKSQGNPKKKAKKAVNNKKSSNGSKAKTKIKENKKRKLKKRLFWMFLILVLVSSLTILTGSLIFYAKYGKQIETYQSEAENLVQESNLETFRQTETSLVYDSNKNLISTLKGEKDVYYLPYDGIPKFAINAMIAIEDKKFIRHEGVDLLANVRAILALIRNKGEVTQGASTITQQLARNIFLSNEVSVERKLKEVFLAIEIENKYSKNLIMEFYLNNIYFGNGYYGIQAASKGYFNQEVKELSLSQIVYLCAIPNNPTIYNPFEYSENTIKRRDRILYQMQVDKYITKDEYELAIKEEIELEHKKMSNNNYVETYVFYSATRALMASRGFEFRTVFTDDKDKEEYDKRYQELYNECQKSLYYEGYRIYTSIDLEKQQLLQQAVDQTLKDYTETNKEGVYALQGAAVSIDNETGRVVAIVGGRYQDTIGYTLNRGYQSYRQPGSSIKPLIVYTPMLEKGYYPDNIVMDEKFEGGPSNSDGKYLGEIELRTAVEKSKNTVAWKLFEELTPQAGLSYLQNMNFNRIEKNDYYPAASLGGFTTGVSPLEMTSAYSTLENDGIFREPTCIIEILDSRGNVVVNNRVKEKYIYTSNASRMMTDILTGVIKRGTGKGLGLDNMTSAGKTGTTNQKKDGWFVGYTPYYTTGVWVGYDIPRELDNLYGASYPGSIWKQYMNAIHNELKSVDFMPYEDSRPKDEPDDLEEEDLVNIENEETSIETPDENEGVNDTEDSNSNNQNDNLGQDAIEGEDDWFDDNLEEELPDENEVFPGTDENTDSPITDPVITSPPNLPETNPEGQEDGNTEGDDVWNEDDSWNQEDSLGTPSENTDSITKVP
jgi:1A family penicillin-binding protein